MKNNENGSATFALLGALPILMAALAIVIAVFYIVRSHGTSLHHCRSKLLESEESRLAAMRELIKLNPEAKKLRTNRRIADKKVQVALKSGIPTVIAAAEAELAIVVAAQAAFAFSQKSLILKADSSARIDLQKLRTLMIKRADTDLRIYNGRSKSPLAIVSAIVTPLPVVAKQSDTPTPDYEPDPQYSKKEVLHLSWKLWPVRLLPKWLGFLGPTFQNLVIEGQCATTGEKKGNHQWGARLTADKPLSNLFL